MPRASLSTKCETIYFRVSKEEKQAIAKEASRKNMALGAWIRAVLVQKLGMEPKV